MTLAAREKTLFEASWATHASLMPLRRDMKEKQNIWIAGAGLTLMVAFFLPWFDLGIGHGASGWDIAMESELTSLTRLAVLLTPILGFFMLISGLAASKNAGRLSLGTGGAILGFTAYKIVDAFVMVSGVGLWLVLGAGLVAAVAGLTLKPSR